MNNALIVSNDELKSKIYTLRGLQVMLDRDLAELYEIKAIRLREQVKRNLNRFPSDFMIKLTNLEIELLLSQNAIPSKQHLGGALPYAFTEQGIANLSSILNSEKAIEVNIQIMRAFVAMRKFLASNALIFQRIDRTEQRLLEHDHKFEQVFDAIQSKEIKPENGIFFDGQIFDAYTFVADLIRSANKSITLIDNYVDDSVLTLFSKTKEGVKTIIFTKEISKPLQLDLLKYNQQYPKIEIREFKDAHDQFLIIDNRVYHFGASLRLRQEMVCFL